MRNLRDLTEDELLEKESDWWEREDESDPDWVNEGVRIFRNLLMKNPRDIRYRETIAYLMLLQGEDFKLSRHSYRQAIFSLKQVVRLDPDNARAHYRLGFLYFYEEEWTKSIESFQRALRSRPLHSRNQLQKDQQIKAHYYISKAAQIILKRNLEKVYQIPLKDLQLSGEMNLLLEEIRALEQAEEKPYLMIVNGVEFSNIREREYEQLSDPFENDGWIILNFRSINDVTLSFNGREISITPGRAALLEYLMRNPDGVSHEDIIQRRYRLSKNPRGNLRQDIRRLRTRMTEIDLCENVIETIGGGYRWNSPYNYRILKHSRDVSTDLLLD